MLGSLRGTHGGRRGRALVLTATLAAWCLALCVPVARAAESPVKDARAAYDRGTAAYDRGDHRRAAAEYALADRLVPNTVALESALKSVLLADDAALGMNLVDRAADRKLDEAVVQLVEQARGRFAGRVGRIRVGCPAEPTCRAQVDGEVVSAGGAVWAVPGDHRVMFQLAAGRASTFVRVPVGGTVDAAPPADGADATAGDSAAPTAGARVDAPGISPAWFWVGVGITAVLGGITVASGLDAKAKHDDYETALSTSDTADETRSEEDGRSAETRTNVLLGVTGAAALATVAVGAFAVRWKSRNAARHVDASLTVAARGPGLVLRGSF